MSKRMAPVVEAINVKTGITVEEENIVTIYDGKDAKVFGVQIAAMTILCNVFPDGSYKVAAKVW